MDAAQEAELPLKMGKLFPQHFTAATGLARGSATVIARQVLANDEASEPTRIRKMRVLFVDRTVNEVSLVSASCFQTRAATNVLNQFRTNVV